MALALRLARRSRLTASPNPGVGAVLVDRAGVVTGMGWHRQAGDRHAEVAALEAAGPTAAGGTLFVTLEPCCHQGLTPPCTEAILAAGVSRVVAAMIDPDPRVAGRGLARLRQGGVAVDVGLGCEAALRVNEAFVCHRRTGGPWVTAKFAASLDGKLATRTGASRWVTGPASRRLAHRWRSEHMAVLVGVGTVLADDPRLTCRLLGGRQPLRVVADSRLRTSPTAKVITTGLPGALIACTEPAPAKAADSLRGAGAEVIALPRAGSEVDLRALLEELGRRGITGVLVEGGGKLHGALFEAGLVHRVHALLAPLIIGGAGAPGAVGGTGAPDLAAAWRLHQVEVRRIGPDVHVTGLTGEGSACLRA